MLKICGCLNQTAATDLDCTCLHVLAIVHILFSQLATLLLVCEQLVRRNAITITTYLHVGGWIEYLVLLHSKFQSFHVCVKYISYSEKT